MELSEATALADKFLTSLCLSVWILPLSPAVAGAGANEAGDMEDYRRQLGFFAVREEIDRLRGRSLHLTISARTIDREPGKCPALADKSCGIYDVRPLSCRAVPLHFSQPDATLGRVLDDFVKIPGHLCDTSAEAPVVFDGRRVTDPAMGQAREDALKLANSDRPWKQAIVSLMDDPAAARAAGLPTYPALLRGADAGLRATAVMLVAWRVARDVGIISPQLFIELCEKQICLFKSEIERAANLKAAVGLTRLMSDYELACAEARRNAS